MYEWKVIRDDNGHACYCSRERVDFYRELAMIGGYTVTVRKANADEKAIMYRGI